mmetsp:Transcript_12999/g.17722  ORF Transcript_12999/g.17722 Transcript_12999/m.17722 type:complete len:120 (+) Transcript_12999:35-394(+)
MHAQMISKCNKLPTYYINVICSSSCNANKINTADYFCGYFVRGRCGWGSLPLDSRLLKVSILNKQFIDSVEVNTIYCNTFEQFDSAFGSQVHKSLLMELIYAFFLPKKKNVILILASEK